jgi:hypothetical protein
MSGQVFAAIYGVEYTHDKTIGTDAIHGVRACHTI